MGRLSHSPKVLGMDLLQVQILTESVLDTIASCVAASRLHNNRHYLSDVVFGAAVGSIWSSGHLVISSLNFND